MCITRQLFAIILILTIQIVGMITFNLLDWDYLCDIVRFGCPASLITLGLLNMLSSDLMYWFSQPIFRKKNKKFK